MSTDALIPVPWFDAALERHEFVVSQGSDYRCANCNKPRALHQTRESPTIISNIDPRTQRIRSPSFSLAGRGKLLTDKQIEKYQRMGYYTAEFYERRRRAMAKKAVGHSNFREVEGRLIYCP